MTYIFYFFIKYQYTQKSIRYLISVLPSNFSKIYETYKKCVFEIFIFLTRRYLYTAEWICSLVCYKSRTYYKTPIGLPYSDNYNIYIIINKSRRRHVQQLILFGKQIIMYIYANGTPTPRDNRVPIM